MGQHLRNESAVAQEVAQSYLHQSAATEQFRHAESQYVRQTIVKLEGSYQSHMDSNCEQVLNDREQNAKQGQMLRDELHQYVQHVSYSESEANQ